jgi:predicted RNA-binding protein with PIN domain
MFAEALTPGSVESRISTVVRVSAEPAADVPDEVLRPTLELAVGVAAAGAKLRPQMPFPVELRRFLRFHKLPPTALAQVRAAIEGDPDFRKRLASVATTELVDEIGALWLSRPDDWEQAIADLLPQRIVDDESALRREERRRLAAQQAAARSGAELLGVTAELERERAAKSALTAERDRLRGELGEVRARLREAQRAEHATAQALAKVESEVVELRGAAPEPIPTLTPTVDAAAARSLIDDAVLASGDILRLLSEALAALAPVDDAATDPARQNRQSRARRQPVRLPGGVLAGSVEAAEFHLRIKGAHVLVDGYNVAKLGWPTLDLEHQREQSIMAAENLAKRWNMAMTIVFDGASVEGAHSSTRRRVRITYSPAGMSADDLLRAEVAGADVAKPVVVVTNDRAIITDVTALGANTVSSDDFLVLLRR